MKLFRKDTANEIKEYLQKGAIIIDVRTKAEWDEGHIESSKHIVLNLIPLELKEITAYKKPVITVCKSGGRSEQAMQFLIRNGIDAINGGSWQNVHQHLN